MLTEILDIAEGVLLFLTNRAYRQQIYAQTLLNKLDPDDVMTLTLRFHPQLDMYSLITERISTENRQLMVTYFSNEPLSLEAVGMIAADIEEAYRRDVGVQLTAVEKLIIRNKLEEYQRDGLCAHATEIDY